MAYVARYPDGSPVNFDIDDSWKDTRSKVEAVRADMDRETLEADERERKRAAKSTGGTRCTCR